MIQTKHVDMSVCLSVCLFVVCAILFLSTSCSLFIFYLFFCSTRYFYYSYRQPERHLDFLTLNKSGSGWHIKFEHRQIILKNCFFVTEYVKLIENDFLYLSKRIFLAVKIIILNKFHTSKPINTTKAIISCWRLKTHVTSTAVVFNLFKVVLIRKHRKLYCQINNKIIFRKYKCLLGVLWKI